MPDPEMVSRAHRAAATLEQAWERWRARYGMAGQPMPPVSSYVGYSIEEPWGRPRVVFGMDAREAEVLAALLDSHEYSTLPASRNQVAIGGPDVPDDQAAGHPGWAGPADPRSAGHAFGEVHGRIPAQVQPAENVAGRGQLGAGAPLKQAATGDAGAWHPAVGAAATAGARADAAAATGALVAINTRGGASGPTGAPAATDAGTAVVAEASVVAESAPPDAGGVAAGGKDPEADAGAGVAEGTRTADTDMVADARAADADAAEPGAVLDAGDDAGTGTSVPPSAAHGELGEAAQSLAPDSRSPAEDTVPAAPPAGECAPASPVAVPAGLRPAAPRPPAARQVAARPPAVQPADPATELPPAAPGARSTECEDPASTDAAADTRADMGRGHGLDERGLRGRASHPRDASESIAAELAGWAAGELPGQASARLAAWAAVGGVPAPGYRPSGTANAGTANAGTAR